MITPIKTKTTLTPADEKEVLGAIYATWDYIAEEYGKTTIDDEIGAALDRVSMHGAYNKLSGHLREYVDALSIKDARALMRKHGRRRLWGW